MDLDQFLDLRGTDLPSVVARVEAAVGLHDGDILLAAGSLVEGLGNSKSDVDLLLITARDSLPERDEMGLVVGRCLVDLRMLRTARIDELVGRLRAWSQAPWDVTHPVEFTYDERTLLHRLIHSHLLRDASDEWIAALMPERLDLARLELQIARQMARTIQVDLAGYREVRDYHSMVFAAQDLLGRAVDALTASYQLTNPVAKWRHRLLGRLPSDWQDPLVMRPSRLSASQQFWRLHRAPERADETSARYHACRITTFARAVFAWAECHLVRKSFAYVKPVFWLSTKNWPQDPPLPYLDFDVDFYLGEGKVMIARLNEFDDAIELSPREFALALLFDGETSASEADAVIPAARGQAASPVASQLLTRVDRANFAVHVDKHPMNAQTAPGRSRPGAPKQPR